MRGPQELTGEPQLPPHLTAVVSREWLSLSSIFPISPENISWTSASQTLEERELEEMRFLASPLACQGDLRQHGKDAEEQISEHSPPFSSKIRTSPKGK